MTIDLRKLALTSFATGAIFGTVVSGLGSLTALNVYVPIRYYIVGEGQEAHIEGETPIGSRVNYYHSERGYYTTRKLLDAEKNHR